MKIKLLILSCLLSLFCASAVVAQVVDMRAYSRQRGFKAYQAPAPSAYRRNPARQRGGSPSASETSPVRVASAAVSDSPQETSSGNASGRENEKIKQTGMKMFQEKDEDKVLNFDVENPEYKKLNKRQQQELMKRISYE